MLPQGPDFARPELACIGGRGLRESRPAVVLGILGAHGRALGEVEDRHTPVRERRLRGRGLVVRLCACGGPQDLVVEERVSLDVMTDRAAP